MIRVLSCIAFEHHLGLVALAAAICTIGTFVSAQLLKKAMTTRSRARFAWGFIGAIAAGSTIWCTHFVAMLAYQPGIPVTYNFGPTFLSFIVAVLGCAGAFGFASERSKFSAEIGGLAFGASVSAMHYCGMIAFTASALLQWHTGYIIASISLAGALGVLAFNRIKVWQSTNGVIGGAAILVLAIVSLHFTGMAALEITPFVGADMAPTTDDARSMIAIAVAGVGLLVLGTGAVAYFLDAQARIYSAMRLRHLAESAVDGMVVANGTKIIGANAEFARMVKLRKGDVTNEDISRFVPTIGDFKEAQLIATEIHSDDGKKIPIELTIQTERVSEDGSPLTVYALRDISQRVAHEQKISYLAEFDSLTRLRNRPSFLEHTSSILDWGGDNRQYAVIAIDLDRFKEINDLYGHAAGDQVLHTTGKRLLEALDSHQLAARIGGDEFVVFSEIKDKNDAVQLAERLEELLAQAVPHNGTTLTTRASFGIALSPTDGVAINALLNNADLAMYRAKSSENLHVCLYDKGMDDAIRERRDLVDELRTAIPNNEFELHYQVQMNVHNETIAGYEALVRWNHPERGLVAPNHFIPLAEETGLIVPLGEWVLRNACEEAATWTDNLPVSVNLSPVQLVDSNFFELVQDILLETGMPPHRLEFEVTETCFITDQAKAIAVLEKIKSLGVSISIDDFGTGYSSLAMLQSFPFDKIKLDKSLIDEIDNNAKSKGVFRAVLSLGEALNVPILAEGVESEQQILFLRDQGCQLVQGYYYGRPERPLMRKDVTLKLVAIDKT